MTGKRRSAERAQEGAAGRGRGRRALGLIRDRRARVDTFGRRKETLKAKAFELSVLCGVDVALVVAAADGDGDAEADVWESTEGAVLARYRALDPEVRARARHTHRAYLEGGLGKEEAKLTRVRQTGPTALDPWPWDKALDGTATAEEAQRLLEAIDAAIRASEDRMRALGLPVDGEDVVGPGAALEMIAPLDSAGVDGYPLHPPGGGDTYDNQAIWGNEGFNAYNFQQCTAGSSSAGMEGYQYDLQVAPEMYTGSGHNNGRIATDAYMYQPPDAGTMQHGYGFHQCAGIDCFGMPAGHQMQELPGWGTAQANMAMWRTEEPRHAMVPVHYPSAQTGLSYMDTLAALGAQGGGGLSFAMGTSCNFVNAPPVLPLAMGTAGCGGRDFINARPVAFSHAICGTSDNCTDTTPAGPLAMSYGADLTIAGGYATQWQAGRSGHQSGIELLRYLGRLEENTQLHLWGN